MWWQWGKSTVKNHDTLGASPSSSSSSSFSFKDIPNLCTEDPSPPITKSSIFHRVRLANSIIRSWSASCTVNHNSLEHEANASHIAKTTPPPQQLIPIPGADKRVVIYFTSLRIVRSTFEDCRSVQSILQGFRVPIDERDLSMDSGFIKQLQDIFGGSQTKLTLPRVFIGGRYLGGADEIRELHEAGELKKLIEGMPVAESGVCDVCGDYRFILCHHCNGSHKLYIEKSGFKTCTACNENGLIRCPSCSCAPL